MRGAAGATGSLYQAIGFVHYWSYQDYAAAADWFKRASRLPGAPIWMEPLAAVTLAEGGNRTASRLLWQQILRTATDDWFRNEAERRLKQLDAMDQMDTLRRVVATFQARQGRPPADWAELARAGYIRGTVADPTGVPYRLERRRGRRSTRSRGCCRCRRKPRRCRERAAADRSSPWSSRRSASSSAASSTCASTGCR